MRILFLSKYPPIEGYVAASTYWLARGLGAAGHEVHVVTNAWEVEDENRCLMTGSDLDRYMPPGVTVHATDPFDRPAHIPASRDHAEKLVALALGLMDGSPMDVLDSWYLLPYGFAGLVLKKLRRLPLVVRHAVSDLGRLLPSPALNRALLEVLRSADRVGTVGRAAERLAALGVKKERLFDTRPAVDTSAFSPKGASFDLASRLPAGVRHGEGVPVIGFFGKTTPGKGLEHLLAALNGIKEDFLLLMVSNPKSKIQNPKSKIQNPKSKIQNRTLILPLQPPWRMPELYRACTAVVFPEHGFPLQGHSPLPVREAMACGRCVLLSGELAGKRPYPEMKEGKHFLAAQVAETAAFREVLRRIIRRPEEAETVGRAGAALAGKSENFRKWVQRNAAVYRDIALVPDTTTSVP